MSGLSWRKALRLTRWLTLNLTHRGASASVRAGRVTASTRGRISVRLGRGLTWRIR